MLIPWLCLKPSHGEDDASYICSSSISSFFSKHGGYSIHELFEQTCFSWNLSCTGLMHFWSCHEISEERLSLYPMLKCKLRVWLWTFWVFSTLEKMVLVFSSVLSFIWHHSLMQQMVEIYWWQCIDSYFIDDKTGNEKRLSNPTKLVGQWGSLVVVPKYWSVSWAKLMFERAPLIQCHRKKQRNEITWINEMFAEKLPGISSETM